LATRWRPITERRRLGLIDYFLGRASAWWLPAVVVLIFGQSAYAGDEGEIVTIKGSFDAHSKPRVITMADTEEPLRNESRYLRLENCSYAQLV
jgi:hypothetical protein